MFDLMCKFLYSAVIITGGFYFSFYIVSHYVNTPLIENIKPLSDEELEELRLKEYLEKYDDDYEYLDYVEMSEEDMKKLNKKYLTEETPVGIVKMYYCHESVSFIYWSEKQIPYKVLENVSKKYVIDFNCKDIYIDMKVELQKKHDELLNKMAAEEKAAEEKAALGEEEEEEESVFVTFKKNNKNNKNKKNGKSGEKPVLTCDKANRYSYRGVYDEALDENRLCVEETAPKKISFMDFMKNKNEFKCDSFQDDSSTNGFWRFLDVSQMAKQSMESGGFYKCNGKMFSSCDELHAEIKNLDEFTTSGRCEKELCEKELCEKELCNEVLECETKHDDDKKSVEHLDSEDIDSECEYIDENMFDKVESGRRNSVSSSHGSTSACGCDPSGAVIDDRVEKKEGWWW